MNVMSDILESQSIKRSGLKKGLTKKRKGAFEDGGDSS